MRNTIKLKYCGVMILLSLLFSGCGGGGGDESPTSLSFVSTLNDIVTFDENITTNIKFKIANPSGNSVYIETYSNDPSLISINNNFDSPITQAQYQEYLDFNVTTKGNSGETQINIVIRDDNKTVSKSFNIDVLEVFKDGSYWNDTQYKIVQSPFTDKYWLDRNLGAQRVCTTSSDSLCYGDYFQWGRSADGHEKYLSTEVINKLATNIDNVGHSSFIISYNTDSEYDWTNTDAKGVARISNWSKVDGSSICPIGFRVPYLEELANESVDVGNIDSSKLFNSFLKIPVAGVRVYNSGDREFESTYGSLWSISVHDVSYKRTRGLEFGSNYISNKYDYYRANGLSVRCIKDIK